MEAQEPKQSSVNKKKPLVSSKVRLVIIVISLCLVAAGAYLLVLLSAPKLTQTKAIATNQEIKQNKIIIPKIGVEVDVLEGDKEVLDKGAWHRFPERGDPEQGGNFIVSAHRFKFAPTPSLTKEASIFYNIDKIEAGDKIIAHWNGKKYNYKVTKRYQVKSNQTEIEKVGDTHMTLYSCTLGGSYDGREVVEATLE